MMLPTIPRFDRPHRAVSSRASLIASAWLLVGVTAASGVACSSSEPDDPPIQIRTSSLSDVRFGENYDQKIEVTGGVPPYLFAIVSGALPAGLEVMATTGQIVGVATAAGRAAFTVEVADAAGGAIRADLSIYVVPEPLVIVTTRLPMGMEGAPYDQTLIVSGGVAPHVWSLAEGTLPTGLSLNAQGRISGTASRFGIFEFQVRVDDGVGTARTQDLVVVVAALDPEVVTAALPKGRVGAPYDNQLEASGGQPPYDWTLASGALPSGLVLGPEGSLSGVPDAPGDYAFTARVTDAGDRTGEMMLMLTVIPPLAIETTSLPQVVAGRTIDATMVASGGEPPYEWSLAGGTLPAGITFDATGRFQGGSAAVGDHPLTIRVRDSEGFRVSALLTLRVSDRYVYESADLPIVFPPVCTSTTMSYAAATIEVTDSVAIEDLDVSVDFDYAGQTRNLRVVLYSPTGRYAVLCGDGVHLGQQGSGRIPGGRFCGTQNQTGGITREYNDEGAQADQPFRPLSTFDGSNPLGTWRLWVGVSRPSCAQLGEIRGFSISMRDDRSTDPYVVVSGYTRVNLLDEPWLRLTGGGLDQHDLFLRATAYSVGQNGVREGGAGDDVADVVPMTWTWAGPPIAGAAVTADGHVTSGVITGSSVLVASGGGMTVNVPIHVVPPDWHPAARRY